MTRPARVRGRVTAAALVVLVGLVDVLLRAGASPAAAPVADAGLPPVDNLPPATASAPATVAPATARPRTRVSASPPRTGRDVHGVVVGTDGRPLAGVHVSYDESVPDAPSFRPLTVTDARGRFAVACETRNLAPSTPALLFSSYDGATGVVDASAPDVAWREESQQCGASSGPGMRVALTPGAALVGTLYQHDAPARRPGLRVGVSCDGMPRGFVDAFYSQVSAPVDVRTGAFRLTGLRTDRCALGVFDRPGRTGREVVLQVDITAGRTTRHDVRDDGQDHFPGHQRGGPSPSPSPSTNPTPLCLPTCERVTVRVSDVPDRL